MIPLPNLSSSASATATATNGLVSFGPVSFGTSPQAITAAQDGNYNATLAAASGGGPSWPVVIAAAGLALAVFWHFRKA